MAKYDPNEFFSEERTPKTDIVPITRKVPVIHGEIDVNNGTVTYHPVRTNTDLVPVVRCKNCRNWDTSWKPHGYEALYPRYYCAIIDLVTTGDWFCADGERKER